MAWRIHGPRCPSEWNQNFDSSNNPYPATDSGRYWQGQLGGGRLTGVLTERDDDGQLRVRLLYDAAGKLRLVTQYYPAAWLRYEAADHDLEMDSLPTSRRAAQWQAVGPQPYLLETYWGVEFGGETKQLSYQPVFRHQFGPRRCYPADLVLALSPAPLAIQPEQRNALRAASYKAAHSRLAQEAERQPMRQPRLLLGATDTLTGRYTLLRRRETIHADSGRTVETGYNVWEYAKDGTLTEQTHTTRSGTVFARTYYANGRPESKNRTWADERRSTHREWDEQGHLLEASRTNRQEKTFTPQTRQKRTPAAVQA